MLINIKTYCIIGLFFFGFHKSYGQDQRRADSIKILYKSGDYNLTEFRILSRISELETNPDSSLYYANILIKIAASVSPKDSSLYAFRNGYLAKGNAYLFKGDNSKAIKAYLSSLDYAEQMRDRRSIAYLQISLADTYALMENNENAEMYYIRGIELLREAEDHDNLASALLNKGDWLFNNGKYDESLKYFEESSIICEQIDFQLGKAYNLGNIGLVYAEQDKDELAEENINKAIHILEGLEDYYPVSVYLTYLAAIYVDKGNNEEAYKYAERSLELAKNYGLKEQISDANLKLYELHKISGNLNKALNHYQEYIIYRDSVRNIEEVQKIANEVTQRQQTENQLLTQKQKTNRIIMYSTAGATLFIGIFAFGLYRRNNFIKKTNKIISTEKERSDHLLLNILPEETAQELKEKGTVEAKKFESVTVLFSDFKGFTHYAENLEPEELVSTVDYYFSAFDDIVEKYGLEKIKTVGDAYMVAGGLPFETEDHAVKMTKAAFEMAEFVNASKANEATSATFDIRIGINTGPVVAGVVGSKKFAYDIWGDAVNIASRMESNSEPGKINISENTYSIIKPEFNCTYRGELEVKNRGKLKMYFVDSEQT
ncbi:adenylate/guanylate cyclase domain-containing protein [Winogradskyella sp. A3E31]|uniref:adenylate/guanylate cyclase domain-containing protein n=1 Tax=Winogradskyella sp. A3E31 TaxID=3349637 RepID=UPI00398AA4A5